MKVAFISPCGGGNLGDAAIQDAFMSNLCRRLGDETRFLGITQNPEDTVARHGVPAVPMDSEARSFARGAARDPESDGRWRRRLRASRSFRRGRWLAQDLAHWVVAVRATRDVDVLAVSGGGQLDDYWGGPWRAPYALFKWTFVARLRRRPTIVLSVGAGTIDGGMGPRLTRFFLRRALRGSRYVSYRDSRTAALAASVRLSRTTPTVPDLAFSHEARRRDDSMRTTGARTVALSPIAYLKPGRWPIEDGSAYASYVERVSLLACALTDAGFRVLLCTSDGPDRDALHDVVGRIQEARSDALESGAVLPRDTQTTESLLACFDDADVVIASRLHGLILANIRGKPTVAISYDWKVDEHMRTMELDPYVRPIESFDPDGVVAMTERAYAEREALAGTITATCARFDAELQAQYDAVVGLLEPSKAVAARTTDAVGVE